MAFPLIALLLFSSGDCITTVTSFSLKGTQISKRASLVLRKNINADIRTQSVKSTDFKSSTSRQSTPPNYESIGVPRLHHDLSGLIRWIEKSGGRFDAGVKKGNEGWNLVSDRTVEIGETILFIPKSICIFSNPSYMEVPLLENAQQLMSSLDEGQWRARLAVALLSERVRPSSHYRSYLRNLPFEFWGMPVFYSTQEFSMMKDLFLMQRTRDRCRFLSEFADSVLTPLQKTTKDPFSGHNADVNAFGWGFASAASRALRNPSVIGKPDGQVMVPGIDLADHHPDPSCSVINDLESNAFLLTANRKILKGEPLTIDYGPLSSDELLSDYGFTVESNPHDRISVNCDFTVLGIVRLAMGQVGPDGTGGPLLPPAPSSTAADIEESTSPSSSTIGRGGPELNDRWLHQWQIYWLSALNLYGPKADYEMSIGGLTASNIDPRLWAYLRILYAKSESDLTKHGYTPFTLRSAGSVLSADIEAQVIKTLVGIVGFLIHIGSSDMKTGYEILRDSEIDYEAEAKNAILSNPPIANSFDDEVVDIHRTLKAILRDQQSRPASAQTTDTGSKARAVSSSPSSDGVDKGNVNVNGSGGFRDGVASEGTPYRIAIGTLSDDQSQTSEGEGEGSVEEKEEFWSPHSATYTTDDDLTGEGERVDGEGEGSLEDAIASMSIKSPTTSPSTIVTDTTKDSTDDADRESDLSSSSDAKAVEVSGADVRSSVSSSSSSTGKTSINVKEAVKYRIRKRMSLLKLVVSLSDLYYTVKSPAPLDPGSPIPDPQIPSSTTGWSGGEKGERRAKIRELVDEVRNRAPKEDILVTASKLSSKWSGKGLAL